MIHKSQTLRTSNQRRQNSLTLLPHFHSFIQTISLFSWIHRQSCAKRWVLEQRADGEITIRVGIGFIEFTPASCPFRFGLYIV
jgi:hypothetical protein